MDQTKLISRVMAGNPVAERALCDAHVERVYRLAYRMTGDGSLAEDLTQETFLRIFDRLPSFRGQAALSTWVHAVAVSIILSGRAWFPQETQPPVVQTAPAESTAQDTGDLYRRAALPYLNRAEALLTQFRVDAVAGEYDKQLSEWARGLLTETRLLVDSPAAADPEFGSLLGDLEMALAQIAHLAARQHTREPQWINRGLDRHAVLSRLRARIPAGSAGTSCYSRCCRSCCAQQGDEGSSRLREQAIFLLAQEQTPEVEALLFDVARHDPDPEIRGIAVRWLSRFPGEAALTLIREILTTAKDRVLLEQADFALAQNHSARALELMMAMAADDSADREVRRHFIYGLAQRDELEGARGG